MKETYEVGSGKTVTITVQVDDALSNDPRARLYTNEEVAAAQVSEAELVGKPLLARIWKLEKELACRVTELEAEKNRADQNKAWAERAETELARRSTEGKAQADRLIEKNTRLLRGGLRLEQSLDAAQRTLRNVSRQVAADRPHMKERTWASSQARDMYNALTEIQEMTSPWADPPRSGTSQA